MIYSGFEVRKIGSAEFLEEIIAKQRDQSIELLQKEEEVRSKNVNLEIEIARERGKVEQLEIELEKRALDIKDLENTVTEQKEAIKNSTNNSWEVETRIVGSLSLDELLATSNHVDMSLYPDLKNVQNIDGSFLEESPLNYGNCENLDEGLHRYKMSTVPHGSSKVVYALTLAEFALDDNTIQHFFFSVKPHEMGTGCTAVWIRDIGNLENGVTITVKGNRISVENNGAYKSEVSVSVVNDLYSYASCGNDWVYLVKLHRSSTEECQGFSVSTAYRPTFNASHGTRLNEPKSWIFGLSS